MAELPKFSRHLGNRGRGTRWWRQILDRKWKYGRFAHAQWKICNITLIYGRIANIFASSRKSGSRNTMVTSDFSPEVELFPIRACAMHLAIIIGTVRSLWTCMAMGQIPRSTTERTSSYVLNSTYWRWLNSYWSTLFYQFLLCIYTSWLVSRPDQNSWPLHWSVKLMVSF